MSLLTLCLFVTYAFASVYIPLHNKHSSSPLIPSHQFGSIDEGYPTHQDWINFGETNNISIYLPLIQDSADDIQQFKNKSKIFFSFYDPHLPSVVIECLNENDVINTMQFLSDSRYNQQSFSIKSGGHGFGGYSKHKGSAMIHVSNMKQIQIIDVQNGIISVETGAENIDLSTFLINHNLTHLIFPTGECPTVSFGGLITGGGISPFSSSIGLAVDTVIGARIVLYNGEVIDTYYDSSDHDDLLWAIKGSGGGNFGVITKYYLQSVQDINTQMNNHFTRYSTIKYQINGTHEQLKQNIYNFFNGISELMDYERFKSVSFQSENADYNGDILNLYAFETHLYETDENNLVILNEIVDEMNDYMGYEAIQVETIFDEYYHTLNELFAGFPNTKTDFIGMNQVRFIKSWRRNKKNGQNKIAEIISDRLSELIETYNHDIYSPIRFGYVLEGLQGKVIENDINFEKTSFQNRDAIATFHVRIRWDYNEQNGIGLKYIKLIDENLLNLISNTNYLGYITNLSGNAYLEQYYPNKQIFKKQRKIKTKYDPFNRFKFEMSIPPLSKSK